MNELVYGITEQEHYQLYQAKHLAGLLADLTINGFDKTSVTVNPESLGVVFGLLHTQLDINYQSI
jgi:hypothetical protein